MFEFVNVRGRNTRTHINGLTMKFGAEAKVEEVWSSSDRGPYLKLFLDKRR